MDPPPRFQLRSERHEAGSSPTWLDSNYSIATVILVLAALPFLKHFPDLLWLLPEAAWNAFVYIMPSPLVYSLRPATTEGSEPTTSPSIEHAKKSEILRNTLGIRTGTGPLGRNKKEQLSAPKGLGNFDNSCYQNSVLQALAALTPVQAYLDQARSRCVLAETEAPTILALHDLLNKLNDVDADYSYLWTPAKLKSMSSWQQQDAQEYYSKIVEAMEKNVQDSMGKLADRDVVDLTSICSNELETYRGDDTAVSHGSGERPSSLAKDIPNVMLSNNRSITNPLEGLMAQRVGCTECGYCEGLSLIPFNSITLPLGESHSYTLQECLDTSSELEYIEGVECPSCSLRQAQRQMQSLFDHLTPARELQSSSAASGNAERVAGLRERLQNVEQALDNEDFSEDTLRDKCQIPSKLRKSSTTSRQAALLRLPHCLVMHINRSVFNEQTGAQLKNYASVEIPEILDPEPWTLGDAAADKDDCVWSVDPATSMLPMKHENGSDSGTRFVLKAVITHQGRHENGHYICWRRSPLEQGTFQKAPSKESSAVSVQGPWWRMSDEDVSCVDLDHVLSQPAAFMLFYERLVESPTTTAVPHTAEPNHQTASSDSQLPNEKPSKTGIQDPTVISPHLSFSREEEEGSIVSPIASDCLDKSDASRRVMTTSPGGAESKMTGPNGRGDPFSFPTISQTSAAQKKVLGPPQMRTAMPTDNSVAQQPLHTAQVIPPI